MDDDNGHPSRGLIRIERNLSDPGPRRVAEFRRRAFTGPTTPSGKRVLKNLSRVNSTRRTSPKKKVTVFRVNSIISNRATVAEEGEEPQRQQWDNPLEFLMSCISMSVGLGNVWRFPFTAYENGGGAFLIPYLIVLLLIGRPMYLLELALGQFSSSGSVKFWDMVPAFSGVGYGQAVACACVVSYYCALIALSIYYLIISCRTVLPWTVCHPDLAQEGMVCVASGEQVNATADNETVISSAELFFKFGVLKENTDPSAGIGMPDTDLGICLGICWLILYFTLKNGVSSSGKVAYFTAIFPYTVLIAFLIRGLTLPGSFQGIAFFFTPQWEKLLEPGVWYAAVTQSFFSLSIGFGTLITYSSYNSFNQNTNKDALIISFADTGTSLLAGAVIFAILGHMAHELGIPIEEVVKSGTGLAFVTYPQIIAKFDFCPQLFAVLFFLMLLTLGLGSAVGYMSGIITMVNDSLPNVEQKKIVQVSCVLGFASGLVYLTPGGQKVLSLVDYYGGSLLILILATVEIVAIAWVYGANRVTTDINFMLGTRLSVYWRFCWGVFCPLCLPVILLYALITQTGMPEDMSMEAHGIGIALASFGVLLIPLHFIINMVLAEGSLMERLRERFGSSDYWGPACIQDRNDWLDYLEEEDSNYPNFFKKIFNIKS